MKTLRVGVLVLATVFMTGSAARSEHATVQRLAEQDYMLQCMGCHQADGSGSPGRVPSLHGLDRFLASPDGRAYLARVPGVAHCGLSDQRLAALLNWTLARFGSRPLRPYTASEVGPLRRRAFANASAERVRLLAGLRSTAGAEKPGKGIRLRPGLWRMKHTVQMPMMAEPRDTVSETCVRDEAFTPEDLVTDGNGCTLADVEVSGDSMRWKMRCPGATGVSTAEGRMTVTGATVTGEMTSTMRLEGQTVSMKMRWDGKRLGDCP